MNPLLQVENLRIFIRKSKKLIPIVKKISFHIEQGECVGIIGESGCGKSLTAQTIACLENYPFEGVIRLDGDDIMNKSENEKRWIRSKHIGIVFQNPQTSLNPTLKIGTQIREVVPSLTKHVILDLLKQVGLTEAERCYASYPHELSGGMCQRVMIAIALARKPKLLIADEPTTALDAATQMQILDLLQDIQQRHMGILLITHDFDVVKRLCNRVLVMYAGEIIETGSIQQILQNPRHPYTKALLASRPQFGKGKNYPLQAIPGKPPRILNVLKGCSFAPRCSSVMQICVQQKPRLFHQVACWHFGKEDHEA